MKYYLHDTSSFDDEKITLLFLKFGYEGIGLFYTLLEKIGKQEKPINTIALKSQLKVGKRLEKCWKFMEEIDIIQSKNGETFNEQLLIISEKYQIKKEKNREKVKEWRERQKDTENVTGNEPVRNRPKVKESKVKESKVKNTLHAPMRAEFESHYLETKGLEYYWTAKDGNALKQIITKLKKSGGGDQQILEGWYIILKHNPDKWINDRLSVSLINSKYNEIIAQIKNSPKSKIQQFKDAYRESIKLMNDGIGQTE